MSDDRWPQIRIASAPVSFGVDEVVQDDAWSPEPGEMLAWMADIGYAGTEMGPPGYLGEPATIRERLSALELTMVGAFLPLHLSRNERVEDDRRWLRSNLETLRAACESDERPFAVLSEAIDEPIRVAWAGRPQDEPAAQLDDARWSSLVANLHAAAELCRAFGTEPVFHPHAGTYVETAAEIDRLATSIDPDLVGLCLDTGHFCFGGADPAASIRAYGELVRHVHLKDCRVAIRDEVASRAGELDDAVRHGVFCPLGTGDAGIDGALAALREIGYRGWIVVEQDQSLGPDDTPASVREGQRANLDYLRARGL